MTETTTDKRTRAKAKKAPPPLVRSLADLEPAFAECEAVLRLLPLGGMRDRALRKLGQTLRAARLAEAQG